MCQLGFTSWSDWIRVSFALWRQRQIQESRASLSSLMILGSTNPHIRLTYRRNSGRNIILYVFLIVTLLQTSLRRCLRPKRSFFVVPSLRCIFFLKACGITDSRLFYRERELTNYLAAMISFANYVSSNPGTPALMRL